jgi:CHAD domain-containing protein
MSSVARSVLTARFVTVREALDRVFRHAAAEPVHKLRVATRRATAALDGFAEWLPRKTYRTTRRWLRDIRQAAGFARDWDVFSGLVSALPVAQPGVEAVLGWAAAQRGVAQAAIDALAEHHPAELNRLMAAAVAAVTRPKGDAPRTLADLAQTKVGNDVAELSAAVAHEPMTDAHLHEVRIAGKRLRYTLELFERVIPADRLDPLTARVKALQDVLGRFNDAAVATRHLDDLARHFRVFQPAAWERVRPGVEELSAQFDRVRQIERSQFEAWRMGWRGER